MAPTPPSVRPQLPRWSEAQRGGSGRLLHQPVDERRRTAIAKARTAVDVERAHRRRRRRGSGDDVSCVLVAEPPLTHLERGRPPGGTRGARRE